MPDPIDWRLTGQERFLTGAVVSLQKYSAPRSSWEHDHCVFCWAKFCATDGAECLREGYVTDDGKHWICFKCFEDFGERLAIELKNTNAD